MKTATTFSRRKGAYLPAAAIICALWLFCPHQAGAQQWTCSNGSCTTTGNVGVGTTSPSTALEVQAPDGPLTLSQAGVPGKSTLQAAAGTDLHMSANARYGSSAWSRYDTTLPSWNIFLSPSGDYMGIRRASAGAGAITWTDYFRVTSAGNVGIGTATPNAKLSFGTSVGSDLVRLYDGGAGSSYGFGIQGSEMQAFIPTGAHYSFNAGGNIQASGTNEVMRITSTGSVGVGTSAPTAQLEVSKSQAATTFVQVTNPNTTAGNAATVRMFTSGNNALTLSAAGNAGAGGYASVNQEANLPLLLMTNNTERVRVTGGGSVGIGITNPGASYKLDVNGGAHVSGDMTVDGNLAAKYQDVAEWVPSSQKLSAGTVVVLDTEHTNQVLASSKSYDTKVAGVVSSQPGISLGQGGDGKLLVATTGRVRVKVDATRAPIKVGDLLVTSDVEGVAMKSIPVDLGGTQIHRPGTIIGKALEPLAGGTGEILVLLSLQ